MLNVLKTQDFLKNLSDDQLAQLMRMPSPDTPQYLVLTELGRRKEMRDEARSGQAPQSTVAEEMVAQAQPQGIVGLPDETLAGAAMRARILGQKQMAGDVTVNPPGEAPQEPAAMARGGYVDYMADGGSAQYGNLFAPKAEPVQMAPQYPTSPATPAFTAPIPTVATPVAQAPIPQQVVPADRYGRHENPTSRQDIEGILAGLTPEQRRRLERLRGFRLSGAGGVGGVGSAAAGAVGSSVGGVGVGGVGGAGVGGAGFAEGGPIRLSAGTPEPLYTPDQIVRTLTDQDLSRLAAGDTEFEPFDLGGRRFSIPRDVINRETSRRSEQSAAGRLVDRYLASGVRGPMAERQHSSDRGLFDYRSPMLNRLRDASLSAGHSIGDFFTKPTNTPYGKNDPAVQAELGIKTEPKFMPEVLTRGAVPAGQPSGRMPEVLTRPAVPAAVANVLAGKTAPKVAPKSAATSGSPTEGSIAPIEAPQAAPTAKDYGSDYMAQQRDLIERLTGSDAEDKERAKNLAIMKAGLAMMSSKDPNFLGAIGAGAQAGLGEYGEAARDIKKQQLARAAMEAEALGKAAVMSQQQDISNRQMAFDERQLAAQTELKKQEMAAERALAEARIEAERPLREAQIGYYEDRGGRQAMTSLLDDIKELTALHNSLLNQGETERASEVYKDIQEARSRFIRMTTIDYTNPEVQAQAAAALASRNPGAR